ncbi:MAG: cbb3-type cytochrome c oxidase subunit 3 [Rubrivivax sp.]
MDINDARVLTTVVSLVLFIGIMAWTWSARRRAGFDEAARLPFADADDANTEPAGEKQ